METVIQAGDADEEGGGRGEVKTREVDDLQHAFFTDEGKGEGGGKVVLPYKGSNIGHYDSQEAETSLMGGGHSVVVGHRKRDAVFHDVG